MEIVKNHNKHYIDYKVYNLTQIRSKYGYRILLKFADGSTQTVQRSGYRTKKEADEARNLTIIELHNGIFVIEKGITVSELFKDYLENEVKVKMTHNTYYTYSNIIKNHINKRLGKIKLDDLNRGHVISFYNDMAKFSHTVLKNARIILKTGINYGILNKKISTDPTKDIELPKEVKKANYRTAVINVEKTLNVEQVKILVKNSYKSEVKLEVMFAVLMGLRSGEIRGLKYDDIDFINRTIKVQRQLGRKANTDISTIDKNMINKQEIKVKTFSSNRVLEIPDILFDEIIIERKKYEKNMNRRINDKTNPFTDLGFICCSTYGKPRSNGFLFPHYKKLLKDSNLPDLRFHDLRATYCTILMNKSFNTKAISKLMGHASEIISVDIYTDKTKIIEDSLEQLEPFINLVLPNDVEETVEVKSLNDEFNLDELVKDLLENNDEESN